MLGRGKGERKRGKDEPSIEWSGEAWLRRCHLNRPEGGEGQTYSPVREENCRQQEEPGKTLWQGMPGENSTTDRVTRAEGARERGEDRKGRSWGPCSHWQGGGF